TGAEHAVRPLRVEPVLEGPHPCLLEQAVVLHVVHVPVGVHVTPAEDDLGGEPLGGRAAGHVHILAPAPAVVPIGGRPGAVVRALAYGGRMTSSPTSTSLLDEATGVLRQLVGRDDV